MIKEKVGSQDQVLTAFGGFRRVEFGGENHLEVQPITIKPPRLEQLQNHLMLFFTGLPRTASEIAEHVIEQAPHKKRELAEMCGMVDEAISILSSDRDLEEFGKLLHQSWQLKRRLADKISTPYIDYLYDTVIGAGATGGGKC